MSKGYPKTYQYENGNTLVARNELQAKIAERDGAKEKKK